MNEKKMSFMDLVFMGMGGCIGAGIFSMLGVGIGYSGRMVWLAFIIAMIFKMSQQVRMVIMSSMFSLSGGMYSQQALILTPMLTGVSALTTVVSAFSFSVFGISLASYTATLIPALANFQTPLACAYLALFFILGTTGADLFSKVQNFLGISKIVTLGMFIVFGLVYINKNNTAAVYSAEPAMPLGIGSFVMAIALMSFTCDGISNIINMASVAENPKKNIPKAWIVASIACGTIYALLGFVGSRLGAYQSVAYANLGDLAQMVLPAALYLFFIIGGAMASLSTALLGGVTGYAPLIQGIAQDGWLPKALMDKKKVMFVMWVGAILPVIGGFTLDNIVAMIMVPSMVLGVVVNLRAMKLPEQYPTEWANTGLNISAGMYRFMMWVSIVASLLTGVFSLMSLTMPLIIGTVAATAFIFWYSNYCIKSGKVNITSTQDLG